MKPKKTKLRRDALPLHPRPVLWFCLVTCAHYWGAPGWMYGILGTVLVLCLFAYAYEALSGEFEFREPQWKDPSP